MIIKTDTAIAPTMELIETMRVKAMVTKKLPRVPRATQGFITHKTPKLVATDFPPVKFNQIDLL